MTFTVFCDSISRNVHYFNANQIDLRVYIKTAEELNPLCCDKIVAPVYPYWKLERIAAVLAPNFGEFLRQNFGIIALAWPECASF